ncbi:MAG: hypothetical protein LUE31_02925 [Lachnospiraceae bacterium]|nr:hypothetical protein [Lachnospiraceae bacterium]
MWNSCVKLMSYVEQEPNEDGLRKSLGVVTLENIPASFQDVTRNDEILAAQSGYTVDRTVAIAACNYNGEQFVVDMDSGDVYEVVRAFSADKSMLVSLSCRKRAPGTVKESGD